VNGSTLGPGDSEQLDAWCAAEQIRCLYLLADGTDPGTARIADANGFRFVDFRVVLETYLTAEPPPPRSTVRPATNGDVPGLAEIARASHTDSRFYFDGGFPRDRCDALYATWIEKSCREGFADAVLVAEHDDRTAGYVSCTIRDGVGQIGLIAVGASARGAGHGISLVRSALRWFHERGANRITVVTQGRNVQAQRLYQRCGFVSRGGDPWFHRWFQTL